MADLIDTEDEWSLDGFLAECDAIHDSPPPAPAGMELAECMAEPRHWPTYFPVVDGMYPAACPTCQYVALREDRDRLEHEARHKPWHRWRLTKWFSRHAYSLGIIAGSCWSNGCAHGCKTRTTLSWRGRRPYILGVQRETWGCLLKRRHVRTATYVTGGLCSKCCPCPDCGSTAADHSVCGVTA